jgi:DNA-binding NtrC family response regulator
VPLNCATLPESLVEVELFGVEAGAYTDARRTRDGLLADAHGATLLLDELCSMALTGQAKLLRVLQFGEYRRVGGRDWLSVDARVIATVSEDPERLVARRRLRADLLYRLAVLEIHVPPLRERRSDIVALAQAFLASAPGAGGRQLVRCAQDFLIDHDWPGNVRELESLMVRAAVYISGPTISADDLRGLMRRDHQAGRDDPRGRPGGPPGERGSPGDERARLRGNPGRLAALVAAHGGYVALAARAAGVPRTTLQRWLHEVGLAGAAGRGRPIGPVGKEMSMHR